MNEPQHISGLIDSIMSKLKLEQPTEKTNENHQTERPRDISTAQQTGRVPNTGDTVVALGRSS